MAVSSYNVAFLKKEQITKDAYKFHFRKPKSFTFEAGQYLKMKLDIKNPDSRGNSRYFTISASPTEKDLFIITKIGRSTFKQALNKLKQGDKVQIRGPWGEFILSKYLGKEYPCQVFLAGGIGLTPFRSILKYNSDKKRKVPIFMINSYSDKKQAALSSVLEEFKNLSGFTLKVVLERITTNLLHKYLDERRKYVYYISGPERMVTSLADELKKKGVKEANIKLDDFPGYTVRD
jgi:ferredoxin-NADP reductase